jgi:hypothetical protein
LATSPGGVDSVAIIAASTPVDVPFVIALQTVRFLLILMVGPSLSGFVARLVSDPGEGPKSLSNPPDVQKLKEEVRNDVGDLD